jgi:hydrogenase expression/formation protein HypE
VVGGDTKVVEHGKADGMYVTTAGIGRVDPRARLSPQSVRPGDRILLSGPIGDHGITILLARARSFSKPRSAPILARSYPSSRVSSTPRRRGCAGCASDPQRGGDGAHRAARDCGLGVVLWEESVPTRDAVRGACELLGPTSHQETFSSSEASQ